jgi:hypothetical protein
VFTRERHAIVAVGVGASDISGEDRGHAGEPKGVGKGVGMSQLPTLTGASQTRAVNTRLELRAGRGWENRKTARVSLPGVNGLGGGGGVGAILARDALF